MRRFEKRSVLLVEDNPGDADLVAELIGFARPDDEIIRVTRLDAAVKVLLERPLDVVLLDLQLPDASGTACVHALRSRGRSVAIVVLTGNAERELALDCLEAGAQDYLSKNALTPENLDRAINYALARVREAREQGRADALQRLHAAVVESSFDAIITCAPDGTVRSWNGGAVRIFGHSSEEAVGRELGEVFEPMGSTAAEQASLLDFEDGTTTELVRRRQDGTPVTVSVVVTRLNDVMGQLVAVAAICRDVTEQRNMEIQLLESDRLVSLGTLAAGVAHEINNPLAALLGNVAVAVQQLEEPPFADTDSTELSECLDDVREAAERIRVIVRDLKLFSHPEQDERTACDVNRVLDSVARMAWPEVQHSAAVVKNYGRVAAVHANESRLSQVFLNLIVNAGQAIMPGNVDDNEIRLTTRMTPDGRVAIDVRDTGPGITPEVQRRLFTPFFTTKPAGEGTGLGLAICQRIVRSLSGELTLESQVGMGTCFTVILPRVSADATAVNGRPVDALPLPPRRGRVMLIDDDALMLKAFTRVVRSEHEVVGFTTAREALDAIARGEHFDVIVCDVMMPVMTGMAFREALLALAPAEVAKVVFATGGAFTSQVRTFLDEIDNPCLEKPFDYRQLRKLINDMVVAARQSMTG